MPLDQTLKKLFASELIADRIFDDVTSRLLGNDDGPCVATVRAKESGIFCGEGVIPALLACLPGQLSGDCDLSDGTRLQVGSTVAVLKGSGVTCLGVERTLLNLLSHLCGVATLTRRYVDEVGTNRTRILATRKTLPGLRDLQLQAVRAGGGWVHRRSLSDGILIKDNHLSLMSERQAIERGRALRSPLHRVEIEVQSLDSLKEVLVDPPEVVMLDNFTLEMVQEALGLIEGRCQVEVSGGIRLEDIRPLADLGVDYISVGRLTHSAPALDLTLDLQWRKS